MASQPKFHDATAVLVVDDEPETKEAPAEKKKTPTSDDEDYWPQDDPNHWLYYEDSQLTVERWQSIREADRRFKRKTGGSSNDEEQASKKHCQEPDGSELQ
mmetsp:Transcript_47308/g.103199  ORF Transcript_47308/g.103199 Transcript_47308/m.103199 type:complete len:101 (+) Transcript_47308:72-374(+)